MYAVILVIFVFILLSGLSKWKNTNQKLMEKFSDIESNSMGRFERFSEIIKAFEEVKNKKPSPNELHAQPVWSLQAIKSYAKRAGK